MREDLHQRLMMTLVKSHDHRCESHCLTLREE